MASAPVFREVQLQCSDGMVLAGQSWRAHDDLFDNAVSRESPPLRILCMHGWMDNARSFHFLAPELVADRPNVEVFALDFVGHGLSSHKSKDGPSIILAEAVYYVAEALHQLGWINTNDNNDNNNKDDGNNTNNKHDQGVTLIGHSMGAAISCFYAAAFPEQVNNIVLLDGAGPLARNPRDIAKHVRAHVSRRLMGNASPRTPRLYPTLELAVETRCKTAENFPGNQWLSTEAATEMVLRGSIPVTSSTSTNGDGDGAGAGNTANGDAVITGFQFRHDPRLQWPSCQFLTWEQTQALYQDLQCPVALLLAKDGWPFDEDKVKEARDLLKPVMFETLPGSHHFHADPDTAGKVSEKVVEFLNLS
ncbi:hypothetical protein ACA910_000639 [Epithemia clementina (nom. ined.)]